MKTVHEVSKLTGVSIRALHHYAKIGLLPATKVAENGYRYYDETALLRLQQILFFKELEFSLKDIRCILDNPDYDREKALQQQIRLLKLRRDHFQNLIDLACEIQNEGGISMKFEPFSTEEIDKYTAEAKKTWGHTAQYRQYEEKNKNRGKQENDRLAAQLMAIMAEFGQNRHLAPKSPEVQALVKKLQSFITEHYYDCTDEILFQLGQMYIAEGKMKENIDKAGGNGTANFIHRAIEAKK